MTNAMAFITPFFASASRRGSWLVAILAMAMGFLAPAMARAEGIETHGARLVASEDGYRVEAEFDIRFSPGLEEAVNRGVALYFVVEFSLSKPRWYWFDEKPVQLSQTYKITYTPLLRQYRLSSGSAYQNFTRLDDLVRALSRLRGWTVAERNALRKPGEYEAAIRMRLDTTQLPKPFQLNAVASRDWNLASDWYRWIVQP
jgi:hypothetical protein